MRERSDPLWSEHNGKTRTAWFGFSCQIERRIGDEGQDARAFCLNPISVRDLLWRPDLSAAEKGGVFIDDQPRRFDVAMQCATGLQLTTLGCENISLNLSAHGHRFRSDLALNFRMLSNTENTGGLDFAFHGSVDQQFIIEFDRAFDRDAARQQAAVFRCYG